MIRIEEGKIRLHVNQVVRETVEQTFNGLLQAEADELCGAKRYARSPERLDALAIWRAGAEAVRSDELVRQNVRLCEGWLEIGDEQLDWNTIGRIVVVGIGKAGAGLEQVLGSLFHSAATIAGRVLFDWLKANSPHTAAEPYRSCLIILIVGLVMRSIGVALLALIQELGAWTWREILSGRRN